MSACKIGQLPDDVAEQFKSWAKVSAAGVASRLRDAGHLVGPTTIKDHRAHRCACTRPSVEAIVAPPSDEPEATRRKPMSAPAGWAPRAEYDDADGGYIVSESWEDGQPEPAEADLLRERGLDPERWTVTSIRYSDWQQSKRLENGNRDVITLHAKRVNIAPCVRRTGAADESLLDVLNAARQAAHLLADAERIVAGAPGVFVHAGGDYQLGKTDGDGVTGTVQRFMDALDYGRERLTWLRSRHDIDTIVLPHLGDCIEGYVSQGGRNAARTTLATSEQVDLLVHLLTEQVAHYAPLAGKLVVPIIPGNHDEEARNPDGLEHHSWATFAAKQLRRCLRMAGEQYDHVRIVAPAAGELTLTLDLGGVRTLMAHGHQHGPGKTHDWWKGQAHGMQLGGDATLLLEAHHHHLQVQQDGLRTSVQVPALEGESRWWRHKTGAQSPPGMVTMLVGEHLGRPVTFRDGHTVRSGWDHLAVA